MEFKDQRGLIEKLYIDQGYTIVGVDEVGRGCIAGDVYAGAVVLDYKKLYELDENQRELIKDSKKLSANQREKICSLIHQVSRSYAVASASVEEIFDLGIVDAVMLAMRRAMKKLDVEYNFLLIDGKQPLKNCPIKQLAVIKGDYLCYSVAAASILAKVQRDKYMHNQANFYPGYGFESHVGYGTKKHMEKIREIGISPIHRRNFEPITSYIREHNL